MDDTQLETLRRKVAARDARMETLLSVSDTIRDPVSRGWMCKRYYCPKCGDELRVDRGALKLGYYEDYDHYYCRSCDYEKLLIHPKL